MINYRAYESRNIDIIHLASISKIKGANDVLLVIKKIKEKVPNIRAVIVGGISDSLKEEIQSMLKDYGIEDNVKILGYVDGFKKFDLLAKSKVMVYPSYMDTFAISVLEALSMGTPVVAYGIPAIKINYRTNAVAKAQTGNIDDLVEKTLKLLSDKQSWEKLSKEAMNFAVTYSWSAIAKSFLACVSEGLRE
uniref:Glycosyltransferase n=1 Tax=Ignisphaera aggregans TaxID=334771 RepID=A0A7J3YTL2_9CREN